MKRLVTVAALGLAGATLQYAGETRQRDNNAPVSPRRGDPS